MISYQLKSIKMRAELNNLYDCAVPFFNCAAVLVLLFIVPTLLCDVRQFSVYFCTVSENIRKIGGSYSVDLYHPKKDNF